MLLVDAEGVPKALHRGLEVVRRDPEQVQIAVQQPA
jgi:hypothetical protein